MTTLIASDNEATIGEHIVSMWTMWLDLIRSSIGALSSVVGLGFAIISATLVIRTAFLPIS